VATVALVRPPSVVARYALTLNVTPPLGIAYLAGSLAAAGHEVQVIDAVGEAPGALGPGPTRDVLVNGLSVDEVVARVRPDVDLVGISSQFSHEWPLVRRLVEALARRLPGTPLVCGGEHATAMPELSLAQAPALTACVLGEGEETLVELTEALAAGRSAATVPGVVARDGGGTTRTPARPRLRGLERVPAPRWDLVPLERYLAGGFSFGVDRGRTIPVLASRGCPYRCTFCSSPQMWGTRYEARRPADVVDEIAGYVARYRVQNVDFYDLTAILRREWVLEFCELLERRRLGVSWQLPSGTRSEALDAEVLAAMVRAGCRNVSYAPESGSERTLRAVRKRVRLERMEASMRAAVAAGLNVKANIIIGFPGEDRRDLGDTLRFVRRMARAGVHDVSVWTFSPYPGSQLFDELRAAGRLGPLDDDYFTSLLSYSDLGGAVSYGDALGSAELQRWRVGALALFYLESCARHPTRPLRSLRNIVGARYESRLEMSVSNLVRRLWPRRDARARTAACV
jgi:anaerobic magnesium-protoporphyrin IX monomethyl ester cyclase